MIDRKLLIMDALVSLRPNAQWSMYGNTYENIIWHDELQAIPSESEILSELERLEQERINNSYQRMRAEEYPSIQEQLDMQYWDKINNTTIWEDTIAAIKEKYPKEV